MILWWFLFTVSAVHKRELFDATITTMPSDPSSDDNNSHDHASHDVSQQCHLFIGIAMTIGFVFMLLVDQLGGSHDSNHSSGTITTNHHILLLLMESL